MTPQTIQFSVLSPQHEKRLTASGIDGKQIRDRGYRTVNAGAELGRLGFGRDQRQTPALLIPICGIDGKTNLHQIRPDRPRHRKGREIEYETPVGFKLRLDIPPGIRDKVLDPTKQLLITVGVFNADAAVGRGLACIASLGVGGWPRDIETWDAIPLKGRPAYIAFGSDVRVDKDTHREAGKLGAFLKARGADVNYLIFPEAPDGTETGLSDFLVANENTDALFSLGVAELPALPSAAVDEPIISARYESNDEGIFEVRSEKGGEVRLELANFSAKIVAELFYVENPIKPREFEIEVKLKGKVHRVIIVADEFERMNWVVAQVGGGAIISAGHTVRDKVRAAIQLASGDCEIIPVYDRTGWVEIGSAWGFLHADGAIHADSNSETPTAPENRSDAKIDLEKGSGTSTPKTPFSSGQGGFPEVRVRLSPTLARYRLPQPRSQAEHVQAVRISLAFLDLAPDKITFPLYAFLWRVLIDGVRYSMFLNGTSGIGKSELSALIVQHTGPEMDNEHLPESFASTANALAATGYEAANVPLVVDDYVPTGSSGKIQRTKDQAETIIRNQGNRAGRNRCARDGSTLGGREPRGGFLFTGEEAPDGVSLGARYFNVQVERGDVLDPTDPHKNAKLRKYQELAKEGWLALATASYLRAIAPELEKIRREIVQDRLDFREVFRGSASHPRVVDNAADLLAGFNQFLFHALQINALDYEKLKSLWERAHDALRELLKDQESHQVEQDPSKRLFELLISALTTGRAHLHNEIGDEPDDLGSHRIWGYEERTHRIPINQERTSSTATIAPGRGQEDLEHDDEQEPKFKEIRYYVPRGEQIGWRRADNIYLEPAKALGVAQRLAMEAGQPPIPLGQRAMGKRLADRGALASKLSDRNTQKFPIDGVYKDVWHVHALRFYEFLRHHGGWGEDMNEEALREHEEALREQKAAREARSRKAHAFLQGEFCKLLDLTPVPQSPESEEAGAQTESPQRVDASEPGQPSPPQPPTSGPPKLDNTPRELQTNADVEGSRPD